MQDTRLESWAGDAARAPNLGGSLALGAVACHGRNDFECLSNRLAALRGVIRYDDQISAFHAYALARLGKIADAEATLKIAWSERVIGPAHLAAEAALAVAQSRDPSGAWKAYLEATRSEPGPVSRDGFEGMLTRDVAGEEGKNTEKAPASTESRPDTVADDGGSGRWIWIVGALVIGLAFALARRGRSE